MKAFDFDSRIIDRYASFSRSFTKIRSEDLAAAIEAEYAAGRFWPDSLLSLNPRYKAGQTIDELVDSEDLDEATGKIFRFGPDPLTLYRHQAQAVAKAKAGQSFVVTTGTGSGKSLCFFVPIVDAIVRARKAGAGLLLSALWDAAFDRALVTFDDDGKPEYSPKLCDAARQALQWDEPVPLSESHRQHLAAHRQRFNETAQVDAG